MRLSLQANAFIAVVKRVYRCGQARLLLEANAFAVVKHVFHRHDMSTANGFVADSTRKRLSVRQISAAG